MEVAERVAATGFVGVALLIAESFTAMSKTKRNISGRCKLLLEPGI